MEYGAFQLVRSNRLMNSQHFLLCEKSLYRFSPRLAQERRCRERRMYQAMMELKMRSVKNGRNTITTFDSHSEYTTCGDRLLPRLVSL